ncbi:MAG TPA: hypothetical protein VN176_02965 [Verrucomicrobiae bacterium]|jgi:hypothetical protein|nr:hypothetical protein [Verrucomicrobiae bacterium]
MAELSSEELCLIHCLFRDCGIYFPLSRDFRFEDFTALLRILRVRASADLSAGQEEKYWEAINQRMEGKSRWDQVAPQIIRRDDDPGSQRGYYLSQHTVENILRRRPYVGFTIDSITYAIEVFNPRNELGLDYAGAGEPVVALLLGETTFGTVQNQLIKNQQFYSILKEFTDTLNPQIAVGMNPATLATLTLGYHRKQVSSSVRPWSFLFALNVMKLPKLVGDVALRRYFKCFQRWDPERVLLQVNPGLDPYLSTTYSDAAKLLGMKAVHELHPEFWLPPRKD